jgi:hypothetical protein
MTEYLPIHATIEQSCAYLRARTGETWALSRLLEYGLTPWLWLDYQPGWPDIFGDRLEGYLAPMCFAGDTQRLATDGSDALVTITKTHDGKLLRVDPGMHAPLTDIRFKRKDIERLAVSIVPSHSETPAQGGERVESESAADEKKVPDAKSSISSSEPGEPRAYWRQLLRYKLAEIDQASQGGVADVVSVIRALKRLEDRRIPNKGTHEELYYLNEYGNEKPVSKKTVSNALTDERKNRQ